MKFEKRVSELEAVVLGVPHGKTLKPELRSKMNTFEKLMDNWLRGDSDSDLEEAIDLLDWINRKQSDGCLQ